MNARFLVLSRLALSLTQPPVQRVPGLSQEQGGQSFLIVPGSEWHRTILPPTLRTSICMSWDDLYH